VRYAELAEILGQEAAQRLCSYCGGDKVYIPRPPKKDTELQVVTLHRAGLSKKAIAVRVNRTVRRIQQIIQKYEML
jgi:DNA-binding NarL/FixJ family response regulator